MLLVFIPLLLFADPVKSSFYSNNPIVAEVDGDPIHLDDLKHVRIQEALVRLYQMKNRALKERVLEKLSKKHPELAAGTKPKVSEAEIKKFYNKCENLTIDDKLRSMTLENFLSLNNFSENLKNFH